MHERKHWDRKGKRELWQTWINCLEMNYCLLGIPIVTPSSVNKYTYCYTKRRQEDKEKPSLTSHTLSLQWVWLARLREALAQAVQAMRIAIIDL